MNKISKLKKAEKYFAASFVNFFSMIKKVFLSFIKFFVAAGTQKITVMLIPHSEKKVFNFRINVFLLFLVVALTFSSIGVIGGLALGYHNKNKMYSDASLKTQKNEKKAREYEELIEDVLEAHNNSYRPRLDTLMDNLDSPSIKALQEIYESTGGPVNPVEKGNVTKLEYDKMEVSKLLQDYRYSVQAFNEINKMTNNYNKILKDLPFGNPVRGFYIITSTFGFRIHPIHKVLDMHQGIDMAHSPGTLITSTAPGVVERVEYDHDGYGWYLKISHKLGFSTLYGHMRSRPIVNPGDRVKKGQIIGYMGSTGASTASHVHYEVRLGNNLLDPWPFISNY